MKSIYLKIICFALVVGIGGHSYAQTQDTYQYQSEFIWGINKNTSGGLIGGLVFKKSRKLSERMLETYGLEVMNVKHPQEVRITSGTGNFFILGKSNYLYAFRFQYGRDFILFSKGPQHGAEVKAVLAVGPTLGIVAPYYVEYNTDNSGGYNGATSSAQYSKDRISSINQILGTGRLFEGLGQSKISPGINVKVAFNFEIGTIKSQVTGFEAGFLLDSYFKKIPLMDPSEKIKNYGVFPTLFLTVFYGNRK